MPVDAGPERVDDGAMADKTDSVLHRFLDELGMRGTRPAVELPAGGTLPSAFAVSDLAQASIGAAGAALARFIAAGGGGEPAVTVDRDLASAWFAWSLRPDGWSVPDAWDPVAGDYAGNDGWIKLHTNAPHHRAAALAILGTAGDRVAVADAVARWSVGDLESAVVDAGGVAASLRPIAVWDTHRQGMAVAGEPLVHVERTSVHGERTSARSEIETGHVDPTRPLAGVRVLDLTRVLAGPVATRLLAGWGAEVLRVDPPGWDEPGVVPEVTIGKRCTRLDLTTDGARRRFLDLLDSADVLVHGYRPGALEGLGLGPDVRQTARPGLVDVSLDAYGWTGPWATRRGYDSLVQMSSGIAHAGMVAASSDRPVPLPVQALDHATGYLLAACALTGLTQRRDDGRGSRWRTSLAAMARLLVDTGVATSIEGDGIHPAGPAAGAPIEHTVWGDARRLPPPVEVDGAPLRWDLPASPLGTAEPAWLDD
jgi:hypothetical protein